MDSFQIRDLNRSDASLNSDNLNRYIEKFGENDTSFACVSRDRLLTDANSYIVSGLYLQSNEGINYHDLAPAYKADGFPITYSFREDYNARTLMTSTLNERISLISTIKQNDDNVDMLTIGGGNISTVLAIANDGQKASLKNVFVADWNIAMLLMIQFMADFHKERKYGEITIANFCNKMADFLECFLKEHNDTTRNENEILINCFRIVGNPSSTDVEKTQAINRMSFHREFNDMAYAIANEANFNKVHEAFLQTNIVPIQFNIMNPDDIKEVLNRCSSQDDKSKELVINATNIFNVIRDPDQRYDLDFEKIKKVKDNIAESSLKYERLHLLQSWNFDADEIEQLPFLKNKYTLLENGIISPVQPVITLNRPMHNYRQMFRHSQNIPSNPPMVKSTHINYAHFYKERPKPKDIEMY